MPRARRAPASARRTAADPAVDTLIGLYEQAELQLQAVIQESLATAGAGSFTNAYRTRQLARVRALLTSLRSTRTVQATAATQLSYRLAARAVDASLGVASPAAGEAVASLVGGHVHQAAMNEIAAALNRRLDLAHTTVGRKVDDVFRRVALEEIGTGVAAADTGLGVAASLERALLREGVTGFVARNGAQWRLSTYARMVSRTTTREAVTQGITNRMVDHGSDLVTISEHGDSDEVCEEFAGQTGRIGEIELPPYHPNCVHVATPAEGNLDAFEAALIDESA